MDHLKEHVAQLTTEIDHLKEHVAQLTTEAATSSVQQLKEEVAQWRTEVTAAPSIQQNAIELNELKALIKRMDEDNARLLTQLRSNRREAPRFVGGRR